MCEKVNVCPECGNEACDAYCPNCGTKMLEKDTLRPSLNCSTEFAGYTPEGLAEKFHTFYESFAPAFGYKTRKESAVAWVNVPEENKKLMIRVCRAILDGE